MCIFEQQLESQLVYIIYYIILDYCHSNHLIPISVLYDFWFLRNTCFHRYTPPFSEICIFILKVSLILEQRESLIINISYFVVLECYHSNHLLPFSALYGFWLLSYTAVNVSAGIPPTLIYDFSLILKVLINILTPRKSDSFCIFSYYYRTLS